MSSEERSLLVSVALTLAGSALARWTATSGFALMALGGALAWQCSRQWASPSLLGAAAPRESWEKAFALGLMCLGLLVYDWRLGSWPEGADYSEGWLVRSTWDLLKSGSYQAVDTNAQTPWPTFMHYQGALAARLFGESPWAFRLPAVFWGLVGLASFYAVARQLFSAGTAAGAALLWLAFHLQIVYARRFLPVVLVPVPFLLGLACILVALRGGRRRWAVAGGAVIGLSLHAYLAARAIPLAFAGLAFWAWSHRAHIPRWRQIFIWTAGSALVVALPVILAMGSLHRPWVPEAYGTEGISSIWSQRAAQVPAYAGLFHAQGNTEYPEDDLPGRPALDVVTGGLAVLGLALCMLRAGGLGAFLLGALIFGLLPAIYLHTGRPPFARRAMAAFPAVFLMAGLALERLRQTWTRLSEARWMLLMTALGLSVLGLECAHYASYARDPEVRRFLGTATYLAGQEMREHPGARPVVSESLFKQSPTVPLQWPRGRRLQLKRGAEEFLFLEAGQDQLLLLAPWMEGLGPILQELYPQTAWRTYREPAFAGDEAFAARERQRDLGAFDPDRSAPDLLLHRALVPAADIAARQGYLDLRSGKPWSGQALAGVRPRLGALFLLPETGTTVTARTSPAWRLSFEGRPIPAGRGRFLLGRVAFIEMEGPADGRDQAPPVLQDSNGNVLPSLAWKPRRGALLKAVHGAQRRSLRLLLPAYRYEQSLGLAEPWQASLKLRFGATQSGDYEFRLRRPGGGEGRVLVQGRPGPLRLEVGVPVTVEAQAEMDGSRGQRTALQLEFKRLPDGAWGPLGVADALEAPLE